MSISVFTRTQIVTLFKEDISQVKISKKLGVHKSTVSRTLKSTMKEEV
jgi:IS30 family transposase